MTKIVSWNVNSIRVRLPHLVQLKETIDPDVIMLQETKSTDENFPFDDIKEMGFEITADQVKNLQEEITDEELDTISGGLCQKLTGGSYGTCGQSPF